MENLRWTKTRPAASWDGVRPATEFGPAPIQSDRGGILTVGEQSEDCLTLNVWTPNLDPAAKLPVMVWIYGGAMITGAGSLGFYDGANLAKRDVVMVTLNYRLGALGFFSHPALDAEDQTTINFGLLDQIHALQWVQENISAFGGDPGNVTIFGESAGAQSVLSLFASPLAEGLFHRGASQSSFGLPSHTPDHVRTIGIKIAEYFGDDAKTPLETLRYWPAETLATLSAEAETTLLPCPAFGDDVLPAPILHTFRDGKQAKVPLIIGGNSYEASVAEVFNIPPALLVKALMDDPLTSPWIDSLEYKDLDIVDLGRKFVRDVMFLAFERRLAEAHATHGVPVWRYYFTYVPESLRSSIAGAPHGGEINFVLDTFDTTPLEYPTTPADRAMAQRVGEYWLSFARDGKPTSPAGEPEWPGIAGDTVLEFGETIEVRQNFMQPRMGKIEFILQMIEENWEEIFPGTDATGRIAHAHKKEVQDVLRKVKAKAKG